MNTLLTTAIGAVLLAGCGLSRTPEAYRDDTAALLTPKTDIIRACYDGVIKGDPTMGGRVTVKFIVDTEKGNIGSVTVDKANTTAPAPVAECVVSNINVGLALNPVDSNQGQGTWVYEFTPPAPVGPSMAPPGPPGPPPPAPPPPAPPS